jgi:site-specific recombinase XerC
MYFKTHSVVSEYLEGFSTRLNVFDDFKWVRAFLAAHNKAPGTYGNYRAFVERLLLWSWIVCEKSVLTLTTRDFGEFISFNEKPPENWIGDAARRRFFLSAGEYVFNDEWRPIESRNEKIARKTAIDLKKRFVPTPLGLSPSNIGQLITICSSFYRYLICNDVVVANPAMAAKDRIPPVKKSSSETGSELSLEQWKYVIDVAVKMADKNSRYERDLFILVTYYSMYLRGAELSGSECWVPTMGAFVEDDGTWWFEVIGRNNEISRVSVRPDFIPYLTRYRKSRNLSPLPSRGETTPLLTTIDGRPGLTDRQIRQIIQNLFDCAHAQMKLDGFRDGDCIALLSASIRWLRNTSASCDAPKRNPVQLRKDLRQKTLAATLDRYYGQDIEDQSNRGHGSVIRPKSPTM